MTTLNTIIEEEKVDYAVIKHIADVADIADDAHHPILTIPAMFTA